MIPSQNISHFEFLGPYVVISKVEIWPIFVVLKKKSKIACFRLKNSFLSFWKKYCLYQSHFFTQLSGIPGKFSDILKLELCTKKKSWPPKSWFSKRWIYSWDIPTKSPILQWNLKNWSKSSTQGLWIQIFQTKSPRLKLGSFFLISRLSFRNLYLAQKWLPMGAHWWKMIENIC